MCQEPTCHHDGARHLKNDEALRYISILDLTMSVSLKTQLHISKHGIKVNTYKYSICELYTNNLWLVSNILINWKGAGIGWTLPRLFRRNILKIKNNGLRLHFFPILSPLPWEIQCFAQPLPLCKNSKILAFFFFFISKWFIKFKSTCFYVLHPSCKQHIRT